MKQQLILMLTSLIILFVLGWYIDSLAHDEIAEAVRLVIYTLAFSLITALLGIALFSILIVRERLLRERANRKVLEREATVMCIVADEGQQVYIRDTDERVTWRNAHLDGRVYANGRQNTPSQVEWIAWQTYTLRHRPNVMNQAIPPLLPVQPQVDLLAALDSVQRCLIVGASDSGKTTLLQWLVSRKRQTSKVIVIDPHAYPDKWPGCIVVGTGRNYREIDKALDALVRLMTKRYDEIGKGIVAEQGHSRITILIDEWRAIVYNVKGAGEAIKALLTESRKAAFSVFVASHSDRAKPLGLEGEYDLKEGFAVVRLSIANGQRQATLDTGNGEVPATLPGPFVAGMQPVLEANAPSTGYQAEALKAGNPGGGLINLEVEPTPVEAHILHLYEAGESISAIAIAVYGSKGGHQNQRIKETLRKYIDDFEGKIVRLIFDWFAEGVPITQIAERLMEMKVPAPGDGRQSGKKDNKKGKWYVSSIRRLLRSEVYIGIWHWRKYKNPKRNCLKVNVPPIIDKNLWDIAQERLEQNKIMRPQRYEYLLTSHLKCGLCNSAVHGVTHIQNEKQYQYYRCSHRALNIDRREHPKCKLPNLRVAVVDNALWNWLKEILTDRDRLKASIEEYQSHQDQIDEPIRRELDIMNTLLDEHKQKYERLIDLYLSSGIDRQYLQDKKIDLEQTINELEEKQVELKKKLRANRLSPDDIDRILAMASKIAENVTAIDQGDDFEGKRWLIEALTTCVFSSILTLSDIVSLLQ